MKTIMCKEHPKWNEFCRQLEGEEGCNFLEIEGKITWTCKGGMDKTFATKLLKDYDVDIEASLEYFDEHGGHCDCEILFNIAE